ncbi:peptidylprolyl isomerase [Thermostilla marina]
MHPRIVIETNYGDIPIELDRENAPQTVDHFLDFVARGFYDNTLFHQVFKDYAIIGGLMDIDFQPKEVTDTVRNEARNGLKNLRGTIGMLRQPEVIDSATTQFFINVKDNPEFDYKGWDADDPNADPADYGYCVFGRVIGEGMQVVDKIAQVPVKDTDEFSAVPVEKVIIKTIRIEP